VTRVRRPVVLAGVGLVVLAVVAGLVLAGRGHDGGDGPERAVAARPARPVVVHACVTRPRACGYPDVGDTGVPAGTVLRPSGPITVTVPHTVIVRRDVRGPIVVAADDVTIADTRVTVSDPTGAAIFVKPGVRGTLIRDATLRGGGPAAGAVQHGILNAGWQGNDTTRAIRVRMYGCSECYSGPGTLRDSHVSVSGVVPGAHYEAVYYGGGAGPLTVRHNTLLNPRPQTAVVFAGTDFGAQQGLTITGNLMAGGGWMVYGGGDDPDTRDVAVTRNRLSRTYFPRGGSFGVSAHMNWRRTTWTDNVWDVTGRRARG
jgi:hypothetical protein